LKEKHISIELKILIVERIFIPKIQEVTESWINYAELRTQVAFNQDLGGLKSRSVRLARNVI